MGSTECRVSFRTTVILTERFVCARLSSNSPCGVTHLNFTIAKEADTIINFILQMETVRHREKYAVQRHISFEPRYSGTRACELFAPHHHLWRRDSHFIGEWTCVEGSWVSLERVLDYSILLFLITLQHWHQSAGLFLNPKGRWLFLIHWPNSMWWSKASIKL